MADISPPSCQADIARTLGVSQSTVSRALKNDPRIGADLRKRVQEVALSIGYRPDIAVQTMVHRRWSRESFRSENIACISGVYSSAELRKLMSSCAQRIGFSLSEFRSQQYPDPAGLEKVLHARGIRGVILDSISARWLDKADFSDFSVVQVGSLLTPFRFHWVGYDLYAVARDLLLGAIDRGYHRIGCVFIETEVEWDDDMRIAAVEGVRARLTGVTVPPILWMRGGHRRFNKNVRLVDEFIRRWDLQGLIAFNPLILPILQRLKLSFPDQIGLGVLHDGAEAGPVAYPAFSEAPVANMAVHLLHGLLTEHEYGVPSDPMITVLRGHSFEWKGFPVLRCNGSKLRPRPLWSHVDVRVRHTKTG